MSLFKVGSSPPSSVAPTTSASANLRLSKSTSCPCLSAKVVKSDARANCGSGPQPTAGTICGVPEVSAQGKSGVGRAIRMADTWEDIQALATSSNLCPSDAASALHRLGGMLPLMSDQRRSGMVASKLVDSLAALVAPGASDLGPAGLTHALDGCARLGVCNNPKLVQNLALRAREMALSLSPQEAATTVASLAALQQGMPAGVLTALDQAIARLAPQMTTKDVTKAWKAFRELKHVPAPPAVGSLVSHLHDHTESYTRLQLASCLEALAGLRISVSEALLNKIRQIATAPPQRPESLIDAGSVGPSPGNMPALCRNGLSPEKPAPLKIPGYNNNVVPLPRLRFPPRAKPPVPPPPAAAAAPMGRAPSGASSSPGPAPTTAPVALPLMPSLTPAPRADPSTPRMHPQGPMHGRPLRAVHNARKALDKAVQAAAAAPNEAAGKARRASSAELLEVAKVANNVSNRLPGKHDSTSKLRGGGSGDGSQLPRPNPLFFPTRR